MRRKGRSAGHLFAAQDSAPDAQRLTTPARVRCLRCAGDARCRLSLFVCSISERTAQTWAGSSACVEYMTSLQTRVCRSARASGLCDPGSLGRCSAEDLQPPSIAAAVIRFSPPIAIMISMAIFTLLVVSSASNREHQAGLSHAGPGPLLSKDSSHVP
jgi:hypothetical protein